MMQGVCMVNRLIAAAGCVLVLAGCEQAGLKVDSIGSITAPSSLSMKAVDVPFSGVVTGEAVFDFVTNPKACASTFTTITTAKGPASHMGLTTWQSQHCVGAAGQLLDAELVLTAANGDEVHATYTGSCAGTGVIGELITCSGNILVSGGTGRFENASGTAELSGAIVFEGFGDFSWPGRWEWKGSIRY